MVDTLTPTPTSVAERSRHWAIPVGILALVALLAAGGLFWLLREDPPAAAASSTTAPVIPSDGSTAAVQTSEMEGQWSVDTSIGTFTMDDETTASFAEFRIGEVLDSTSSSTAVGRTPAVAGLITIRGSTVTQAEIDADLASIVGDSLGSEETIQRVLGTNDNPVASFILSEPVDLGDEAASGDTVSATATGYLAINGITNRAELTIEAQLVDGKLLMAATTQIDPADYGIVATTAPAIIELQVWLTR